METATKVLDENSIAPCGMNCGVCIARLRSNKPCCGCKNTGNKPNHCYRCVIKNCEQLAASKSQFCFECEKFPCRRLKQLDQRYRKSYKTGLIQNLIDIQAIGLELFLRAETDKWTCPHCQQLMSIHRDFCLNCKMKTTLTIRPVTVNEAPLLEDFLYEAIYQPEGAERLSRDIIKAPEIDVYISDFGKAKGDHCLVADLDGKIIGAVWVRILTGKVKGFGNVDDRTPELAISLLKEHRGKGVGALLMKRMIILLKEKGHEQVSLSVTKANHAVGMYKKLGFEIIKENNHDYLMLLKL